MAPEREAVPAIRAPIYSSAGCRLLAVGCQRASRASSPGTGSVCESLQMICPVTSGGRWQRKEGQGDCKLRMVLMSTEPFVMSDA